MVEVLDWVARHYPELELRIAWNQPMLTHHGNVHHQVLGRIQAHGYGTRARHHDPFRASHARARHGLRHNARPPTLDQALRLRTPQRVHSTEKQDITSFWRPKS